MMAFNILNTMVPSLRRYLIYWRNKASDQAQRVWWCYIMIFASLYSQDVQKANPGVDGSNVPLSACRSIEAKQKCHIQPFFPKACEHGLINPLLIKSYTIRPYKIAHLGVRTGICFHQLQGQGSWKISMISVQYSKRFTITLIHLLQDCLPW